MSRKSKSRDVKRSRSVRYRKIIIPDTIQLYNAVTGDPIKDSTGTLTFKEFMDRIFRNPVWMQNWKAGLAMKSIRKSLKEGLERKLEVAEVAAGAETVDELAARRTAAHRYMIVADDDWAILEQCAKEPKMLIPQTGGTIDGFAVPPEFADQILPFQLAIIDAKHDDT